MNIHIFGHSVCRRSKKKPVNEETFVSQGNPTFVDMFFEKYNLKEEFYHQADCSSEERILYFLKKCPEKIDVAIIFHSLPYYIFCPGLHRDLSSGTEDSFWETGLIDRFQFNQNVLKDIYTPKLETLDKEKYRKSFESYIDYFYTNDLAVNRYNGALMQIDSYLTAKKIPAIHCMLKHKVAMPSWFKFSSGIVDHELASMQTSNEKFPYVPPISDNHISVAGNQYIFDKLESYIQQLLSNK